MKLILKTAHAALLGGMAALTAMPLDAAPITTWRTFKATTPTVISGETTDDPVVGNLSGQTAAAARILGYFTPQTLTNPGDKLTLTFSVVFADSAGSATGQDNFRFGLFDLNGEPIEPTLNTTGNGSANTEDLRGYIVGVDSNTNTPQGSVRERVNSTSNDPFAGGTAASLGVSNTGSDVTIDDGPTYNGMLTLTLNALGGVDLAATFTGNGGANAFAVTDSVTPFKTFGAVGFLNGSAISTDQVSFQNVDVTFTPIPEPATLALGSMALLGVAANRRRRSD